MSFRWTVFCSVDKWKCTTAVSDFDCHFLVFLLLSSEQIRWKFVLWAIFWHHIAFVCWAGTTICLPDEYIPFVDGMRVAGTWGWFKLCASCQWESDNIHLQGSTIACFKEDESHSSGEPLTIPKEETHTLSHLSLVCMFPHLTGILNLSDPGCCFKKPLLTRFGHSPNFQGGVGS